MLAGGDRQSCSGEQHAEVEHRHGCGVPVGVPAIVGFRQRAEHFDPCKVLATVAGQFDLTKIDEITKGHCGAEYGAAAGVLVSIKAWPDLAYKDATSGANAEFSETTIGSSKAKVVKKGASNSSCLVAVEVTPTSRVDFISSVNASLDDACAAATAVATAVEPTLPK